MRTELTSRERILRTLAGEPVDHVPVAFSGICHGDMGFLRSHFFDAFGEADYLLSLGADAAVTVSAGLNITREGVEIRDGEETAPGGERLRFREYMTPEGALRQAVRLGGAYPDGPVALFSDAHVPPRRSAKYLVDSPDELAALRCLLRAPTPAEVAPSLVHAAEVRRFCDARGILMSGTLQGVGDPLMWLSGVENVLFAAMDEPEFLDEYVDIVSRWSMAHLRLRLDMGVGLILRRGWYESADFWSPALYERFLLGPLRREVELAHDAGVKYAYVMNSGVTPLAGLIRQAGVDILTNTEPEKDDLRVIKGVIGGAVTMCTGVNNYHVLEAGGEDEVEAAVVRAMEELAPGGRFILSPSDSINYEGAGTELGMGTIAGGVGLELGLRDGGAGLNAGDAGLIDDSAGGSVGAVGGIAGVVARRDAVSMRNFRKMLEVWRRLA